MRRRLFQFAATVSLVLCVAIVVAWVRSASSAEHLQWNRAWVPAPGVLEHRIVSLSSADGVAYLGWTARRDTDSNFERGWNDLEYSRKPPSERAAAAAGVHTFWKRRFGYDHVSMYAGSHSYIVAAPHWVWAIVAASLPALALVGWTRKVRASRRGLCPACGYDMRATPDHCPECGAVPKAATRTAA